MPPGGASYVVYYPGRRRRMSGNFVARDEDDGQLPLSFA
jgi:hypothetical protein